MIYSAIGLILVIILCALIVSVYEQCDERFYGNGHETEDQLWK